MPTATSFAPSLVHAPGSFLGPLVEHARFVARSEVTVLLSGEAGAGKEAFARCIHAWSQRAAKPLITVRCGAVREDVLERELFGPGSGFAAARGGTLHLDEIGELPEALQTRLLELLERNPIAAAEVRLIVTTKRDLATEVDRGRFLRALHHRLRVCHIELPALRSRVDDIEPLFMHFWGRRGERRHVHTGVIDHLREYPWPGNVRELETLVERLALCSPGPTIGEDDLPLQYRTSGPLGARGSLPIARATETTHIDLPRLPSPVGGMLQPMNLGALLRDIEAAYIDAALAQTSGNRQAAASLLGLQRTTLVEKLRRRQQGSSRDNREDTNAPSAMGTA